MEDITKKATQQPKKLTDLQESIILLQEKLIGTLEVNIKLMQENTALKETMLNNKIDAYNANHVIPAHNGVSN